MFAKPFKVKSNNSLKNSEKKHLVQRILDEFPTATEEVAKELVPMKSSCSSMKLTLHNGEVVEVFVVNGAPLLLAAQERLLPTVVALWRAPALLPAITMHSPILSKIQGGAPLYLPGVVLPAGGACGAGGAGWPQFARGAALALRTQDNAAAAALARAKLSSGEMLMMAGGVCAEVLHWAGDQLCREPRFGRLERPLHPPAAALAGQLAQLHIPEQWPALGGPTPAPTDTTPAPTDTTPAPTDTTPAPTDTTPAPTDTTPAPTDTTPEPPDTTPDCDDEMSTEAEAGDSVPTDMDELLCWVLLGFLKQQASRVTLPLLSSLLYRNYLLPLCPPNRTLDVKKSSYKKVGKFLEAMEKEGYLQVREVEKGVDAVTALNAQHPRVRSHAPPPAPAQASPAAPGDAEPEYTPPQVRELYAVTAAVADLLQLKKGTTLTGAELQRAVATYVRAHALPTARAGVTLDAALAKLLNAKDQEVVGWEALQAGVRARLTACTELCAGAARTLLKARLEPVRMAVASRSGNKKVTLVSNLEAYGFSLAELARECQRGVAASCGVTRAPGAKRDQLMLQGDQTYYVAKLLIEKYGLPKKFVEGADKALKKKKGS